MRAAEFAAESSLTISPQMLLPDLIKTHPEARGVFDRHGLRGCGGPLGPHETIGYFARVHGVEEAELLRELAEAIDRNPAQDDAPQPAGPHVADVLYRRYFIAAILTTLTAGATWGAWLLWQIAMGGSFRAISVSSVNAHGEAQIFGWVGLFIMGFAYQAFPRIWQTELVAPRLAAANCWIMISGIILRTIGMTAQSAWSPALATATAGGLLELASVLIFVSQIATTFRRSGASIEPYAALVLGALGFFVASSVMSVWHTWKTMTAIDERALVWAIATYQFPLRDLQIHGLALFMILGVSLRMLPRIFVLPETPTRQAWWSFGLLLPAVLAEVILFLTYRWTGNLTAAVALVAPWLSMIAAAALVVWPWKLWRPIPDPDRAFKFVRSAYAWLFIALVMLLLTPAYQAVVASRVIEMKVSHAYLGATRHAITVGFISLMIMGMAAKVVPTLSGVRPQTLPSLWGPFLLVNLGCTLRVTTQTLTDWLPALYPFLGVSGTLEVIGLAWWGTSLILIIARAQRETGAAHRDAGPAPEQIEPGHYVGDILWWFPETEAIFLARGFTALRNPRLRGIVAAHVTLARAAAFRGVPLDDLLQELNTEIQPAKRGSQTTRPLSLLPVLGHMEVGESS
jgi:hypothetical protein